MDEQTINREMMTKQEQQSLSNSLLITCRLAELRLSFSPTKLTAVKNQLVFVNAAVVVVVKLFVVAAVVLLLLLQLLLL